MIMLIQRVDTASVSINNKMYNKINKGLLIFVGIHKNDTINDVDYLIKKSTQLRIFNDKNNKMNLSIKDIKGEILLISQFTLIANTNKGIMLSFFFLQNLSVLVFRAIQFVLGGNLKFCKMDFKYHNLTSLVFIEK